MRGVQLVVLSGCSAGGKSTLLALLAERGYRVCTEPGRRVVQQQTSGGDGLPWQNPNKFFQQCIALALEDYAAARVAGGLTVFDRSLVDALAGLERFCGALSSQQQALLTAHPYSAEVLLTPPWPELFIADTERKHSFAVAEAEYEHLCEFYPAHGYAVRELPKMAPDARADWVEEFFQDLGQ